MKAVIYARVSSKEQEREGFSIPAQLDLLRSYAAREGFQVLEEFTEAETAKSAGREKFSKMVAAIKKRKTSVAILVEKTDRLYRNIKDFILLDELMNSYGVEIHKVKEGKVITNDLHSSEKFMELIKVGMAKQYIDNLSEEVKKGQAQKVKEGGWSWVAPYGYRNNKETKQIEPHPDSAPFVKRAFELYSQGHSIQSTIEALYAEGMIYRPHATKINKTKLRELLMCKIYMGDIEYSGEIYQGKHEPLVSRSLWYQVQVQLRKGNKPMEMTKQDFLFKGKVTCEECGKPFVGEYKKGGRYAYYRCSDMRKTCSQGYISEGKLIKALSDAFAGIQIIDEHKAEIKQAVKDFADLKENTAHEQIDRVERERKRLLKSRRIAYQDRLDGVIDAEMYREIEADYNKQMNLCEEKLARLRQAEDLHYEYADMLIELPEMLGTGWNLGTWEEKKQIVNFTTSNFKIKNGNPQLELVSILSGLKNMLTRTEWRCTPHALRAFMEQHIVTIGQLYRVLAA